MEYVDIETARASGKTVLVVSGVIPSPWSEAAKGIFLLRRVDAVLLRGRGADPETQGYTGARNVPVALHGGDPPRTGWAEILELAERIGSGASLVPADRDARVRLFGMAHELAGENGLGWSSRLLMIDRGIVTAGAEGFPDPVAKYLAPKYGHAPDRIEGARRRIDAVLALFDAQLADGREYLLGGDRPSALDVYLATFLTPAVGVTEAECPRMRAELRAAFAYLVTQIGDRVSPALRAHRARMFERHLPMPITL